MAIAPWSLISALMGCIAISAISVKNVKSVFDHTLSFDSNPYFRVLRSEVKSLAEELHGVSNVEDQERRNKIKTITKEINILKRKLSSLEKKKSELIGTNK
jgi:hypothetical protein